MPSPPRLKSRRRADPAAIKPTRVKDLPPAVRPGRPAPVPRRRDPRAQRRAARRPALVASVLVLAVLVAAVAVAGILVAGSMRRADQGGGNLAWPLKIYPVVQTTQGSCLAGTQGVTGPGPVCYQVTEGIAIHRLSEVRTLRDAGQGYEVFIRLSTGDKRIFGDLTRRTQGQTLAFMVQDHLVTVSRVDGPILGGQILITGLHTKADADRVRATIEGQA